MGSIRLGRLPDSKPWQAVIGRIADGADVAVIAGATSAAAVRGLRLSKSDPGVTRVLYLLAHTALAARRTDFTTALAEHQIQVPEPPGLFALTAGYAGAVRRWHLDSRTPQTDLGQMAALAATEALTHCLGARSGTLFPTGQEVHRAARELSTRNGFALLAHEFYARFTRRFLLYHLARELSQHVGGNGRFATPGEHNAFLTDLDTHCREAAVIVREYAGGWYSKSQFEGGITSEQAGRFCAYALTKLRRELEVRGAANG
ncbi:hypothetical protein VT84_12475 [Gemmata sp. SH-PL17]|uniref:hypothetical protein n=1 Tax=Gemmata sp. SH-PL17 TaxID=1630693 RepID=UPI00078EC299|nr:hypothetical protein [Gemmata sp. SH-PL17]AMV25206.1 hypothetical protein VT84_12475 [Gemmata sp. SH-PL17]